jgi:hypothetical protein
MKSLGVGGTSKDGWRNIAISFIDRVARANAWLHQASKFGGRIRQAREGHAVIGAGACAATGASVWAREWITFGHLDEKCGTG